MKLPDSMRVQMREPLGVVIEDQYVDAHMAAMHAEDHSYVITVGDRTTERMLLSGRVPSLSIVDGLEERQERQPPGVPGMKNLKIRNPAAHITDQSVDMIREAVLMRPPIRLLVDGEEDLLVLPACLYAPEGAVVMYGQPGTGVVVVHVTGAVREKVRDLMASMDGL